MKHKKHFFTLLIIAIVVNLGLLIADQFILTGIKTGSPADFPNGKQETTSNSVYQAPEPFTGAKIINATVTMYSGIESCSEAPKCTMASGKPAYDGAVACPRSIPLGTRISIYNPKDKENTLRALVCEDRTAKRFDGRFDIFAGRDMNAYNYAKNYGIKKLQVTIYDQKFN
jgi:3D (Asp-Asp-Asp) domain-containing protein